MGYYQRGIQVTTKVPVVAAPPVNATVAAVDRILTKASILATIVSVGMFAWRLTR